MNFAKRRPEIVVAALIAVMALLLLAAVALPHILSGKADKPLFIVEEMRVGGETLQKVFPGDIIREEIPWGCQIRAEPGYYIGWNSPRENGCRFEHHNKDINVDQVGWWDLIVYDDHGNTIHEYTFNCVE